MYNLVVGTRSDKVGEDEVPGLGSSFTLGECNVLNMFCKDFLLIGSEYARMMLLMESDCSDGRV